MSDYGLTGEFAESPKDLRKLALQRAKEWWELTVPNASVAGHQDDAWDVARPPGSRTTRLRKHKTPDEIFEDRVWSLFYRLGFPCLNKDRKCRAQFKDGHYTKQLDVVARDDDNVFVVECKTVAIAKPFNARQVLQDCAAQQDDIRKAVWAQWGKSRRVSLLVAVDSPETRSQDEEFAASRGILLWSSRQIGYVSSLCEHVGPVARYQLYSILFRDKERKSLGTKYLAIRAPMGGRTAYCFMMPAKDLLKYAYVHHRRTNVLGEASQAYQRMLDSAKLRSIARYVDEEAGFFPNTVIVSFSKPPKWEQSRSSDDVSVGLIELPPYPGCAWVVDGQHRLYGAASAHSAVLLPVMAFEDMPPRDQANLFVEINHKQTSVPGNLLWDLYTDIYEGVEDPRAAHLYRVALAAKRLNDVGPLAGHVDFPSKPATSLPKLTPTSVCDTIRKYLPWAHLAGGGGPEGDAAAAANVISDYYTVLKEMYPEGFRDSGGETPVFLSNNGFGVMTMFLGDIVKHLASRGDQGLLRANQRPRFKDQLRGSYLPPVIQATSDAKLRRDIRSGTGRGKQRDNADYLVLAVRDYVPGFAGHRQPDEVVDTSRTPAGIAAIEGKAGQFEAVFRTYVFGKLKQAYGEDKWWKTGIPQDLKVQADKRWEQEVRNHPEERWRDAAGGNEHKFEHFGLGEQENLVVWKTNWNEVFEPELMDAGTFQRRM